MTILIAILAICVLLVLHPYVTYPLSLMVMRAVRPKPLNATLPMPSKFAVVCCVYNERQVIEQKIANMRAIRDALGDCQLLIHSDASSDGTNEVLKSVEGEFMLSLAEGRSGKSAGMNRLLSMTDAEIVIYTDANVMIDPIAVNNLPRYFRDPQVGCVTGHLLYENAEESQTAKVGALYWKHEEWVKQLESDTGSVMGADGSLFAIRRALHRPTPADIIDDFFTSMSILCSGYRLVRGADFLAYERAATVRKDEFRRKVRIACRAFNCHRLLWPRIVKLDALSVYKYLSHKYLRWLAGYFLAVGAAASAGIVLLAFGALPFAAYVLALGAAAYAADRFDLPVVTSIWEIMVAMWATAIGVYKSLRGERFQTWTIASSTRK
ncbi:MAG: glycosyltransferase [Mesorhizobium sp.]|nr:glycosyltransferase [Mesorhizobium sp.]MBL8580523.1 glycosyltransferase [Mesorhizobium sp.]